VYYNFAAGSFLSKKLCSRLHSTEVDFYSKKRKSSLFEPPFRRLRGNVRTSSIARWKARMYDFLFVIIELFLLALTVETLQAEICQRERFLKGVGHFDRPFIKVEEDVAHQPLLGGRKLGLPFHMV